MILLLSCMMIASSFSVSCESGGNVFKCKDAFDMNIKNIEKPTMSNNIEIKAKVGIDKRTFKPFCVNGGNPIRCPK